MLTLDNMSTIEYLDKIEGVVYELIKYREDNRNKYELNLFGLEKDIAETKKKHRILRYFGRKWDGEKKELKKNVVKIVYDDIYKKKITEGYWYPESLKTYYNVTDNPEIDVKELQDSVYRRSVRNDFIGINIISGGAFTTAAINFMYGQIFMGVILTTMGGFGVGFRKLYKDLNESLKECVGIGKSKSTHVSMNYEELKGVM